MQADSGEAIATYAGHVVFTKEDFAEIKSSLLADQVHLGLRLLPLMTSLCQPRTLDWSPRRPPSSRL
ncbi:rCG57806 [Rattus norvegicus]|uniref:RCG57806 n=1 Tax=Rattus norvegicus TaxID=10116 RepID=A6JHT9_RAT|nr:rCG57806 [Rattus norvegicus]